MLVLTYFSALVIPPSQVIDVLVTDKPFERPPLAVFAHPRCNVSPELDMLGGIVVDPPPHKSVPEFKRELA